jgi:hypothetical protein
LFLSSFTSFLPQVIEPNVLCSTLPLSHVTSSLLPSLAISERDLRALRRENLADMATNADLATALTALAAAISTLTNQNAAAAAAAAPPPPAVHTVVLDPFESNEPFDLSTRTGSTAFATACAALKEPWNGTVETFPAFIISLRIRAGEVHWNSQVPT